METISKYFGLHTVKNMASIHFKIVKTGKFLFRELIFDIEQEQEEILSYLTESLLVDEIEIISYRLSKVICCFSGVDFCYVVNNHIDEYWIDGFSFFVNYELKNKPALELIFVAGSFATEESVMNYLKLKISEMTKCLVKQQSDCWIQRKVPRLFNLMKE